MILERNERKQIMNSHYQVIVLHYPIISSWPSNRWIQESRESSTMDEIGKVEENEIKWWLKLQELNKMELWNVSIPMKLRKLDKSKKWKIGF
jgi:hypothetical protein